MPLPYVYFFSRTQFLPLQMWISVTHTFNPSTLRERYSCESKVSPSDEDPVRKKQNKKLKASGVDLLLDLKLTCKPHLSKDQVTSGDSRSCS